MLGATPRDSPQNQSSADRLTWHPIPSPNMEMKACLLVAIENKNAS
jgi:hypothetical protein